MRSAPPIIAVRDLLGRPLESLRLSVTDRCNLRCLYCMPEEDYTWLPRDELLTFEELTRVVEVFAFVGVRKIRLTGGEPLLRRDLHELVAMIAANSRVDDIALTTNGVLLDEQAAALRKAGLHRVTISLDTLRPDRFRAMTRRDDHARVLAGISAAQPAGFTDTKLDAVIVRGVNDDELTDLIEFGRAHAAEVRFIEYMDVAGATQWLPERVVSRAEMLQRLEQRYGKITPASRNQRSPGGAFLHCETAPVFGIIASDHGSFLQPLQSQPPHCRRPVVSLPLRYFRAPICAALCARALRSLPWQSRFPPYGARAPIAAPSSVKAERFRGAFVSLDELQRDPHLEMHTRGG